MKVNNIYLGDNLDLIKNVDDKLIDLTLTSPPYDNLRTYGNIDDNLGFNGYSFDFEPLAQELFRVTKDGGVIVWVVGDAVINGGESGNSFKQAIYFMSCGFKLYDTMIFQKMSPSYVEKTRYTQVFEYMFVFSKGKPKTINLIKDKKNKHAGKPQRWGKRNYRQKDGSIKLSSTKSTKLVEEFGIRHNIWIYKNGKGFGTKDKEAYKHPATFPEKLAEDHILSWSNPDDLILDPFMGSGTVIKMSLIHNRKYLGFEIEEEYYNITKDRIEKYDNNLMKF